MNPIRRPSRLGVRVPPGALNSGLVHVYKLQCRTFTFGVQMRLVIKFALAFALGVGCLSLSASPASATGAVDNSTLSAPVSAGWVVVSSSQSVGGSFVAGSSGVLDQLVFTAQTIGTPTNLTAAIYATDGAGLPIGTALASQAVDISGLPVNPSYANAAVVFLTPAHVTRGTRYSFVLTSSDSGSNAFGIKFTTTTFANISKLTKGVGAWVSTSTNPPLFATYLTPDAGATSDQGDRISIIHQALPMPSSGKCADLVDADFAWGTGHGNHG